MTESCAFCDRKVNDHGILLTFEAIGKEARREFSKEGYTICRFCALSLSAYVESLSDLRDHMDDFYNASVCETVHLDEDEVDE